MKEFTQVVRNGFHKIDFATILIVIFFSKAVTPTHEMPPSYDEVIRLPSHYPKISRIDESLTTVEEIENDNSITTITSQSPAVVTQQRPQERAQSSIN